MRCDLERIQIPLVSFVVRAIFLEFPQHRGIVLRLIQKFDSRPNSVRKPRPRHGWNAVDDELRRRLCDNLAVELPRVNNWRVWNGGLLPETLQGLCNRVLKKKPSATHDSATQAQAPTTEAQTPAAEAQTPATEAESPATEAETPKAEAQTREAEARTPEAAETLATEAQAATAQAQAQAAAILGGDAIAPSIILNPGEALAVVGGGGGGTSCSQDQPAPSAEEKRNDPSTTEEAVGVGNGADDGDDRVLSVPVSQRGDCGLEVALLSVLSPFSRFSDVHLVNLKEGSPRDAVVRRLLLNSITEHRSHLVSHCPSPPCQHFAPKMKVHITSVQWLRNPYLQKVYDAKQEIIEGSNRDGCGALPEYFTCRAIKLQCEDTLVLNINEFLMYHGTAISSLGHIMHNGFDPRRSLIGMFGFGT